MVNKKVNCCPLNSLYSMSGNKTFIPWLLGEQSILSLGMGKSSRKLLPLAFALGQQFPMVFPHTSGQQFDCSP